MYFLNMVLATALPLSQADKTQFQKQIPPPATIEVYTRRAGLPPRDPEWMAGVGKGDGKRLAILKLRAGGGALSGMAVYLEYPPLFEGDFLPLSRYGRIYRVQKLSHPTTLVLVASGDVPPNHGLQPYSFAIPLRHADRDGSGRVTRGDASSLEQHDIYLDKIEAPIDTGGQVVAKLRVDSTKGRKGLPSTPAEVKVGDILLIGRFGHEVRNIVPADKKRHTIGWIEFALAGTPEAELKDSRSRVVRPVPLK